MELDWRFWIYREWFRLHECSCGILPSVGLRMNGRSEGYAPFADALLRLSLPIRVGRTPQNIGETLIAMTPIFKNFFAFGEEKFSKIAAALRPL